MTSDDDLHDVIGFWSEIKLEIVRKYLPAYTTILSKQNARFKFVYVDAFAGSGTHISRTSGLAVPGSPSLALAATPPFQEYHFIDLDERKTHSLEQLAQERKDVTVHQGDCNTILLEKIFPRCRYEDFVRAICLLDPYGLQLDWNVLRTAGGLKTIEIFLNFPVMDINRNALAKDYQKERPKRDQLTRFWGDESWKTAAYERHPTLFGDEDFTKTTNREFVDAFCKRLKKEAGFAYVPEPLPMRNTQNAIVYYLIFASPNATGGKIVSDILESYRTRGFR